MSIFGVPAELRLGFGLRWIIRGKIVATRAGDSHNRSHRTRRRVAARRSPAPRLGAATIEELFAQVRAAALGQFGCGCT